jgi:hypothetical protein
MNNSSLIDSGQGQIHGTVETDSWNLNQHPHKPAPAATSLTAPGVRIEKHSTGLLRKRVSGDSFQIFSKLPAQKLWLRSGIVERQTSATDFVWQQRMMILTEEAVIFSKLETDAVVDRLPLRNITFVGKVDRRQDALPEQEKWGSFTRKKKRRKNSTTALFTPAARPTLAADGSGTASMRAGGFALEIRTAAEDRERSYFFRTDTMDAREMWLTHILDAVRAAAAANSEESSAVHRFQVALLAAQIPDDCSNMHARFQFRVAALCDSGPGKYVVTAAILIDFLAAVPPVPARAAEGRSNQTCCCCCVCGVWAGRWFRRS